MSPATSRDAVEHNIRALYEAGDKTRAATYLLEAYGRELLGFLTTRLQDRDAAAEVFSQFSEDLWRGLNGFRWRCSARVWSYTLARHAACRYLDETRRRRRLHAPLSQAGPLSEIADRIRTETSAAARSEARNRLARLRESLPAEDQTLLILRVNRKLAWKEIAQIMTCDGEATSDAALHGEAARLRKRFQLIKDKLRQLALTHGLIRPDSQR